jgi:hypothetical protein
MFQKNEKKLLLSTATNNLNHKHEKRFIYYFVNNSVEVVLMFQVFMRLLKNCASN